MAPVTTRTGPIPAARADATACSTTVCWPSGANSLWLAPVNREPAPAASTTASVRGGSSFGITRPVCDVSAPTSSSVVASSTTQITRSRVIGMSCRCGSFPDLVDGV